MKFRVREILPAVLLALLIFPEPAQSGAFQPLRPYPSYDSVILNPFEPTDESARLLAIMQPFYLAATGRAFTVRDLPGRGGINAWIEIAGLPDDGYTLALTDLPALVMHSLKRNPPYAMSELRNVCLFASMPLALWVPANSPFDNLYALINQAFDKPDSILVAGNGRFTPQNLASLRLDRVAGIKTGYMPYSGANSAGQASLEGKVHAFWAHASPLVASFGVYRPLAVAAEQRHQLLPDTPTFAELGYDLAEISYFGLCISASTNAKTSQSVNAAFLNIARNKDFQEKIAAAGFYPAPLGAFELSEYIKSLSGYYAAQIEEYDMQ